MAESFCQRQGFDVEIILCSAEYDELFKIKKQMEEGHYRYACIQDYNVENDKPDIVVFYIAHVNMFFEQWGGVDSVRRNTKYIAVVPYDNAVKFESDDRMERYYDLVYRLQPDIFIVAAPIYKVIKDKYDNVIQMDSPKFDMIYRKTNGEKNIPKTWEKLNGKKVVLWTTIHGHDERDCNKFFKGVAFDLYIKEILDYFSIHKDICLIFRPHPSYVEELVYKHKIWTKEDLQCIKDYFACSNNMIWDDSPDYSNAFAVSDGLLTDDGTGITLSYLPTRKPICILWRNNIEVFTGTSNVTQNYYKAHNFSELVQYFGLIERNEDPMYEKRMCTVAEFISEFDGKNGMRIADKIVDDFYNRCMVED